ncbi:MAG: hypothetical protein LBO72_11065 [Helicobacteraceae bacterium]|jgi:hypothetical protein|nr:hypothetical protein [Helicobacteraceae bacterium]
MPIPMTAANVMDDVEVITQRANQLPIIQTARRAFLEGLKTFALSPAEKMTAIATWEEKFALDILGKALQAALDIPVRNAQANASQAQAQGFVDNLKVQQALIFAQYAGMAANNNIMTEKISKNMARVINAILNNAIILDNP